MQESGLRAATAGRSRAGLTICPDYGRVVVVDIGRSHAVLYLYDMALQCVFRTVLPDHGGDGNELLTSISDAIFQGFSMEELHAGKMKSIGLLFQDDTEISEFRVMYSTGYTAATISLREALFTQFKVPIVEEYSRVYTVSRALAEAGKSVGSNYAHIDLGDRAVVQIVQKEQPVALRSEGQADITGLLLPEGGSLLELAQNFEAAPPAQQAAALKKHAKPGELLYGAAEQCGTDALFAVRDREAVSLRPGGCKPGVHARGGAEDEKPGDASGGAEPGSCPYACLYGNGSASEPAVQHGRLKMKLAVVYGENKGACPRKKKGAELCYKAF